MRKPILLRHPVVLALVLVSLAWAPHARAQTLPPGYHVETLASGLDTPCAFDFLPDGRVLFTEQNAGRVRLLIPGSGLQAAAVLTVPGVVSGGERGLLGIAIDPFFPARPYLYLMYSASAPSRTRIARFTCTAGLTAGGSDLVADPSSRHDLLATIPDAASNHNGGTLRFASDGTLIASVGDDAFPCGAQDSTGLRGVLLRMRVDQLSSLPGAAFIARMTPSDNPYATSPDSNARLVLARGLRNPFRIQCDATLPWLIIGDVGENLREELDLLALPSAITRPPSMAAAGANFGWPYLEGTAVGTHAGECAPAPAGLAGPAHDYDRTQQSGASIIPVGYVPQVITLAAQPGIPSGLYFSDYYSGALTRLVEGANAWQIAAPVTGQPSDTRFGEGFRAISDWRVREGLWFVRQSVNFAANTGSIGRVMPDSLPGPGPDPGPIEPLVLRALGIPAQGNVTFLIPSGVRSTARLTIHDARGRIVRSYDVVSFGRSPDGLRRTWDGLDDDGGKVGPGLYWARLEADGREVTARVVFLR